MKKFMLLVLFPLSVHADMIEPSYSCVRPAKPSQFASEAEHIAFRRQAGLYRQCLMDFINEQNREARVHAEAARQANELLQRFGM